MIKKIKITIKTVFVFVMILDSLSVKALGPEDISAVSAVLIEQSTGDVLFAKEENKRMKPASTTKILTAILALEKCRDDSVVTVSAKAAGAEGSSMYLEKGDKMKMEDIIYGLMLNSGNDAAVAVSEYISGSEEKFASLMNKKAKELGAVNSRFVTPNGLDDDLHYTTAHDLALISAYAMSNPRFREIVSTVNRVALTENGKRKYMHNHNKLLSIYNGCTGIKTGFTKASGRTLVSSAKRDDLEMIAVTLKAPDDWNDHIKMLDYGFENYELMTFFDRGEKCGRLRVEGGEEEYVDVFLPERIAKAVKKEDADNCYTEYSCDCLTAPVKKGSAVGKVYIKNGSETVVESDVFAAEDIDKVKMSFLQVLTETVCSIWLD